MLPLRLEVKKQKSQKDSWLVHMQAGVWIQVLTIVEIQLKCITEAQETAKQRLTPLAARLMSRIAEAEAKGINTLMPTE